MARAGETIENPVTGERITWLRVDADLLEWEDVWTRPGHRVAPHVHPGMTETWRVLEGRAAFSIGDEPERVLGAGESIAAPAGVAHSGWNSAQEPTRLHVKMEPPLRWAHVAEQLFAWAREGRTDAVGTPKAELLIALLGDYAPELAPP